MIQQYCYIYIYSFLIYLKKLSDSSFQTCSPHHSSHTFWFTPMHPVVVHMDYISLVGKKQMVRFRLHRKHVGLRLGAKSTLKWDVNVVLSAELCDPALKTMTLLTLHALGKIVIYSTHLKMTLAALHWRCVETLYKEVLI